MQIKDKVLDVPVIQGGMGVGVSLSSLAGAVAANGACGVISSVNAGYDEQDFKSSPLKANLRALDYHIKRAKQIAAESTKKGLVAVNIMTAVSHYEESCKTAVSAGADIIMLDNMSHEDMREAMNIIGGKALVEVSGNVTKENIAKITDLGVDFVSSGALTHSAPIMDISLKNLHPVQE